MFYLLHTLSNDIFFVFCIPLVMIFLYFAYPSEGYFFAFCLTFVVIFDGLQGFGCKREWNHLASTHQRCYMFVLLIFSLPRLVSTLPFWVSNNLLYLALLRWPSIAQLYDCPFLFMNIFFKIFHKIKLIFVLKKKLHNEKWQVWLN